MIGVFDSGMGGIISLRYLEKELPNQNFLYLGDTKNLPYGEKSSQFLESRTHECLKWMFKKGCNIIILACNTASAYAIRSRQAKYPERKVLSVTIPGVEKIIESGFSKPILLATNATLKSGIYTSVVKRLFPLSDLNFEQISGGNLVKMIENNVSEGEIVQYVSSIFDNVIRGDCLVLGCTHYPLIQKEIELILPDIPIINPSLEAAQRLVQYCSVHPKYFNHQSLKKSTSYYVTGESSYGIGEELAFI